MPTETTFADSAINPFTEILNHYLSLATLIGAGVLVLWLLSILYVHFTKKNSKLISFIGKYALPLGFLASLGGTFLSLYYQYGLGYEPCELCWLQRIFLYPLVVLFGMAWFKKDTKIFSYILGLSLVGEFFAIYHHMLQMGYDLYKPCSKALFAVSCAKPSFIEFGFVSFPFMAVVLFGFMILLSITAKSNK